MTTAVDTARVAERRKLRFNSVDDALAELDRIVAAEKAGTLRQLGNWTPGQIFGHLAAWINYGYEGYPMKPPPWPIRMLIKMKFKTYLREGMPAGVKIPGVDRGTYATDPMPNAEGADRLRRALERLRNEPEKYESPALGAMSHENRVETHLRHCELHMGFLAY